MTALSRILAQDRRRRGGRAHPLPGPHPERLPPRRPRRQRGRASPPSSRPGSGARASPSRCRRWRPGRPNVIGVDRREGARAAQPPPRGAHRRGDGGRSRGLDVAAVRRRDGRRSHLRAGRRRHEERARRRHGRRRRLHARRASRRGASWWSGALVDEEDAHDRRPPPRRSTAVGRELDAAIICEPEENELCLEQRGVVWARFRVRGKMAHGAMPEAGVNPITCLGRHPPRGARRSSDGCGSVCEKSRYLRAADGDADHHPGPAARGRRPAVERDPGGGRD